MRSRVTEGLTAKAGGGFLPGDTVFVSVRVEICAVTYCEVQESLVQCVSGDLVAGEVRGSRTLTGKLVAPSRYSTHCLTQV